MQKFILIFRKFIYLFYQFLEKSSTLEIVFDGLGSAGYRFCYNANLATDGSFTAASSDFSSGSTDFGAR